MSKAKTKELTHSKRIAELIGKICERRPDLPFSHAEIEIVHGHQLKPSDLTIYTRTGTVVLTGELKLPYALDGLTPYNETVVQNAFEKANGIGQEYFFTWNIHRFVLWRTFVPGKPLLERDVEPHLLPIEVRAPADLERPEVWAEIGKFLEGFLEHYAKILAGTASLRHLDLDEKFINILEAGLDNPVAETIAAVVARFEKDKRFAQRLRDWMLVQGWTLQKDLMPENLERAAKLACYVLANRLIFFEALRTQYELPRLRVPKHIATGKELGELLEGKYFRRAREISRDYETVFVDVRQDFAVGLPYLADTSVPAWRDFVDQIDRYDFSKLPYDITGAIYQRLNTPEERHKFGQHFTRPEIVDLINAFAIMRPDCVVLDPACGGGTFLVRSYARLKYVSGGGLSHDELLRQIYGVEIAGFPAHLSTMVLAVRDLKPGANYPRVIHNDFFLTSPTKVVMQTPMGPGDKEEIKIGMVDAVVTNPPYLRQEDLGKSRKVFLQGVLKAEYGSGLDVSGRADFHVYFWWHAAAFLKEHGRMGILTSSYWLDVEYGFKLQKFVLDRFAIYAVLESQVEPWFVGARVLTAVTLLEKESNKRRRDENLVRFVLLKKRLSEVLHLSDVGADEERRQRRVEEVLAAILGVSENTSTEEWRIRVVPQAELYAEGVRVGALRDGEAEEPEEDEE